ncbi:MAG: YIP1 family protein, partial [Anaerolineales bacterium]
MTESASLPLERPRRFHFDWVLPALFRPRQTFAQIAEQAGDVWLTPIAILMALALVAVAVAGPLKQAAAQTGQTLPPDFEFWTPEQQAQFMQAQAATSGPVFVYVFPAIVSVLGVWVGWLVMVGLLHLVLTLIGGRGSTRTAMNVVAWASLPFAVRELVRIGAMLTTRQLIANPGLSGFAPAGGGASAFLAAFLGLIDIYLIWHIVLLVFGVRAGNGLATAKAAGGVLLAMLL